MRIGTAAIGFVVGSYLACGPAQAQTGQQIYDRAEAALTKGDTASAVELFSSLAIKMQKSTNLSKYQMLARYGDALLLNSELEEAAIVLDQALAGLKAHSADAEAMNSALEQLALAQFASFDYGPAAQSYAALVERLKPGWQQVSRAKRQEYLSSLALATFWSGQANAEQHLDALLAETDEKDINLKEFQAYVEGLRARFALTRGDMKRASEHSRKAMNLAGGVTTKTTLTDRVVRQDAALVAWFHKDQEKFLEYTAMSGAARLGETDKTGNSKGWLDYFSNRINGTMPVCATLTGVTPQDVVVIEFAIGKQGQPIRLQPVYSSNLGKIEKPFLQVAKSWSFNDNMAELKTFWRESYRVALRCQTARNDRPSALKMPVPIRTLIETQSVALGLPADAMDLIDQPKIFARVLAAYNSKKAENPTDPALGPLIFMLLKRSGLRPEKSKAYYDEFDLLADKNSTLASLHNYFMAMSSGSTTYLQSLADNEKIKSTPDTLAFIRAKLGLMYEAEKNRKAAEASYQAIVDSSIAAQSPYRLLAMLHLASMVQKADPAKAAELFKATSLQPDQCALYDVQPVIDKQPRGDVADFGFFFESQGWVHTELDIDAKGKSGNVRVVASYPPFLHEEGAGKIYRRVTYQPIFRGNGEGCKGYSETRSIVFKQSN
jgi:hypothetical protein